MKKLTITLFLSLLVILSFSQSFDETRCYNNISSRRVNLSTVAQNNYINNKDWSDVDEVYIYVNGRRDRNIDKDDPNYTGFWEIPSRANRIEFDFGKHHYWTGNWRSFARYSIRLVNINPTITVDSLVCDNDVVDILISPSGGAFTNTFSGNGINISGSAPNLVFTPSISSNRTEIVNFNYQITSNGCTFDKTESVIVEPIPQITWSNQFTTPLLSTNSTPINLNATATPSGTNIIYGGSGISNSSFIASSSGSGTHTISAFATSSQGCKDTIEQTAIVLFDPGTPTAPRLAMSTTGYKQENTSIGHTNGLFAETPTEKTMHVCDGQQIELILEPFSIQQGYDSLIIYYTSNGNRDSIGTIIPTSRFTYTIPQTNSNRTDFLELQFKSSLGVLGNVLSIPVFVTGRSYNNSIFCGNIYTDSYSYPTSLVTLKEMNNSVISTHTANNFNYILPNGLKEKQIIKTERVETTTPTSASTVHNHVLTSERGDTLWIQPWNYLNQLRSNGVPLPTMQNIQTCYFNDTIRVVRNPIPSISYLGDSLILEGTTVNVQNTSSFADTLKIDLLNGDGFQYGQNIIDTLFINDGQFNVYASDRYGCYADSSDVFVSITSNPSFGMLDTTSSGVVFPARNGLTDFNDSSFIYFSEMHVCDGQVMELKLDTSRLFFSKGIDSVRYSYENSGVTTYIGTYGINQSTNFQIPTSKINRIDSLGIELKTTMGFYGELVKIPIYVNANIQKTSELLKCTDELNIPLSEHLGHRVSDYDILTFSEKNGVTADNSTFKTEYRTVLNHLLPNANSFSWSVPSGQDVDTIFRRQIINLPFKSNGFDYYNAIGNPQSCVFNDTLVIARPTVASFTHNAQPQITVGTAVRHISTSTNTDSVNWKFEHSSFIYTWDTTWVYLYQIGSHGLTLTTFNDYGCIDTLKVDSYTSIIDWTGIEENVNSISEVSSYPNPVSDILTLKIVNTEEINATLFVVDLNGRFVLEKELNLVNNENYENIDFSMLPSGVYTCKIIGKNINISQKIVKQ